MLAHGVRLREPFTEFVVDVGGTHESEIVNVISRRESLNRSKSQVVDAPGQHKVAIDPILPRCDLRERHSHVKCDSRFFRNHYYRSKIVHCLEHHVEQFSNPGGFAPEVTLERVQPACMSLISIRERPVTLRAFPQRALAAHRFNVIGEAVGYEVLGCWIQFVYIDEAPQKKQHRCNRRVSIDLGMQYRYATIGR